MQLSYSTSVSVPHGIGIAALLILNLVKSDSQPPGVSSLRGGWKCQCVYINDNHFALQPHQHVPSLRDCVAM